jgi:signal transduction histidine kinase
MFRRISYTIALQFTAFVFLLVLVNGTVFLVADFHNARRQSESRLGRSLQLIATQWDGNISRFPQSIPAMIRERVRIFDIQGQPMYVGGFFAGVPFLFKEGMSSMTVEGEQYGVLTAPVLGPKGVRGYVQVADVERFQSADLWNRIVLYLLVDIAISTLTFLVGLFFARRSLKPAEAMMERLEQFTQDASHELRTPLAALSSSLDLALHNKKYQEGLLSAKEDLRNVATLVERLLELARLDRFVLQREVVDFSELVKESVAKHEIIAEGKNIDIVSEIHPGVTVSGDAALLRQVLNNLLGNAIKFSKPGGGKILVRLSPSEFVVEDEGIGIDRKDVNSIFERFYQADDSRAHGGFGLGLALVKRIVDLHHWSVSVRSIPNEGTAFTVTFASRSKKVS